MDVTLSLFSHADSPSHFTTYTTTSTCERDFGKLNVFFYFMQSEWTLYLLFALYSDVL